MKKMSYLESVHRDGRIWGYTLLFLILAFPTLVCIIFQAVPQWQALGKGLFAILPMYWAVGIVEVFTYVPMLGAGGEHPLHSDYCTFDESAFPTGVALHCQVVWDFLNAQNKLYIV